MPLTVAEYIDQDISNYLNKKPDWSIFKRPFSADNASDHNEESVSLIEPEIASSTILDITSHVNHSCIHSMIHPTLDVNYFNFKADYKEFSSHCKITLTFNVSIESNYKHKNGNSCFNIFTKAYSNKSLNEYNRNDTKLDVYNIYSKINCIKLISVQNGNLKKIYKVNVLLAVTEQLKEIRKNIKIYICLNNEPNYSCTALIPITYFSILKHTFINIIHDLYDIIILNDVYSTIMQFSGKLHWCLGESFIYDTLDISDNDKMNQPIIDKISKGINPKIKSIYYVTSMEPQHAFQTKLNGINLLLYNSEIDKIEIVRECVKDYNEYICLRHGRYKDDDVYNKENNAILKKYLALDVDTKLLKNKSGKLDFMLWIEWEQSVLTCFKWENWKKRLCNNSLNNLIDWYEMKRIRKENKKKIAQSQRVKSVKQQRKARQKSNQRYFQQTFSKNKQKRYNHKQYLYNRW